MQKQPPEVFYKKSVFKNFAKFTGKHLHQSLMSAPLLKKELWHRNFPVNFAKFSRTTFLSLSIFSQPWFFLTLSWRKPLSYRNQAIELLCKSMDWFLYDNGLRHERVNLSSNPITAWKVSKYGVISGPNTGKWGPEITLLF